MTDTKAVIAAFGRTFGQVDSTSLVSSLLLPADSLTPLAAYFRDQNAAASNRIRA
jgi:hypothetical protein